MSSTSNKNLTEREFALTTVIKLQEAGFIAYWAGGCVRDQLLGLDPVDYDVATSATPETVQGLFRRTHAHGASFGVVEVLGPRKPDGSWHKVQVATFRTDGNYSDGRRPDRVEYSSPEEDAKRRDFTINAMFYDPVRQQLHDFVDGQADLQSRMIRAVGQPEQRFSEDKLRILRAVRMTARFEFSLESATAEAVVRQASSLVVVSAERICEELRKILTHPSRVTGVRLCREFGLLDVIVPEVSNDSQPEQRLACLPYNVSFPVVLAALLLPVTKTQCKQRLDALRLSHAERDRTLWLHEQCPAWLKRTKAPRSVIFPILAHDGVKELEVLVTALANTELEQQAARSLSAWITMPDQTQFNPPPLLTGTDLLKAGFQPGRMFKSILDAARAAQLDGEVTTTEQALAFAHRFVAAAD